MLPEMVFGRQDLMSLDQLARIVFEERQHQVAHGDDKHDWYEAERRALAEARARVESLAFTTWKARGRPRDSADRIWREAEELIMWEHWAKSKLMPYLAIEATGNAANEARRLEERRSLSGTNRTGLLVVLDGGPEYSRSWFRASNNRLRDSAPEQIVDAKDSSFYTYCVEMLLQFGAEVITDAAGTANIKNGQSRMYQDACIATFEGERAVFLAVNAALRLRRSLLERNEELGVDWTERWHARAAIGNSWLSAMACLPMAMRDEFAIDPACLELLRQRLCCQELLIASGMKVGPLEDLCH
jgi:hypothetical protein